MNTTPAHMFSTSLGTVTFKPGAIKFFYDPTAKSLSALAPPPPLPARLCSASQAGHLDDGPIRDAASLAHGHRLRLRQRESVGSGAGRGVDSLLNQETKDALNPPNVFLTTQDLVQFSDMRVDPLDEVRVQAQVQ